MTWTITESLSLCKRYTPGVKRTTFADHPCSIARTLDVVGEWWTPLILRDVAYGVRRFREIQDDLGISANVLADRLDALVAEGLLETRLYQERPERREYVLTSKGAELIPALLALKEWGDHWKWPGGQGPVSVLHQASHSGTIRTNYSRINGVLLAMQAQLKSDESAWKLFHFGKARLRRLQTKS